MNQENFKNLTQEELIKKLQEQIEKMKKEILEKEKIIDDLYTKIDEVNNK